MDRYVQLADLFDIVLVWKKTNRTKIYKAQIYLKLTTVQCIFRKKPKSNNALLKFATMYWFTSKIFAGRIFLSCIEYSIVKFLSI